jgi:hypothetical protein
VKEPEPGEAEPVAIEMEAQGIMVYDNTTGGENHVGPPLTFLLIIVSLTSCLTVGPDHMDDIPVGCTS